MVLLFFSICFLKSHSFVWLDLDNFPGTVIRDEMGFSLEKADNEVLGSATKIVITKDSTLIVTDGSTREAVEKRVSQIQGLVEVQQMSQAALL